MISENLRVSIRQEHNDVLDTMLRKVAYHIVDEGLSPDRYHPLWDVARQGREAGPCPACKHKRLHRGKPCRDTPRLHSIRASGVYSKSDQNRSEQAQTTNLGTPILRPHLFTFAPRAKPDLEDHEFKPILRFQTRILAEKTFPAGESPLGKRG